MTIIKCSLVALSCLLCGCGNWHDRLIPRAAFDLQCPESEIQARLLSDHVAGVVGCGKRATYNDVCRGLGACQWVLNDKE